MGYPCVDLCLPQNLPKLAAAAGGFDLQPALIKPTVGLHVTNVEAVLGQPVAGMPWYKELCQCYVKEAK